MSLTTFEVLTRTEALARELGVECTPRVLADRSNLVMQLDPHPLVARAAMATSASRVGIAWLRREVELTRHLHARGARVTRPATAIDPGPYDRDGLVVSFWALETLRDGPLDTRAAGRALAEAHRAAADFPQASLPRWGAWTEALEVLERARRSPLLTDTERDRLARGAERAAAIVDSAEARSASFQPVHGDAHLGNVLTTARGTLWGDWEDAFVGPIEWDLACLRSKADLFGEERDAIADVLAAYDHPYDAALVSELGLARNVTVIAWLTLYAERQPELLPRVRARLSHLPE